MAGKITSNELSPNIFATTAEALDGTNNTKIMTPLLVAEVNKNNVESHLLGATDLNTLKTQGRYSSYEFSNSPFGNTTVICTVDVIVYSPDWLAQVYYSHQDQNIFSRNFISGTTWTPWKKLVNQTGGEINGNITINKAIPTLELVDNTIGSSYQVAYNRSATADYGVQFRKDGNPFMVVRSQSEVNFYDANGNAFSVQDLKSGAVNVKTQVAAAITAKGVQTAATATGAQMAANIAAINTGLKYATGQYTAPAGNRYRKITVSGLSFTPHIVTVGSYATAVKIPNSVDEAYYNISGSGLTVDKATNQLYAGGFSFYYNTESSLNTVYEETVTWHAWGI